MKSAQKLIALIVLLLFGSCTRMPYELSRNLSSLYKTEGEKEHYHEIVFMKYFPNPVTVKDICLSIMGNEGFYCPYENNYIVGIKDIDIPDLTRFIEMNNTKEAIDLVNGTNTNQLYVYSPAILSFFESGTITCGGITYLRQNTEPIYEKRTRPVIHAVIKRNTDLVKTLIEKQADINARDSDSLTALMWAALYNRADIVKLLLENGADSKLKIKNRVRRYENEVISTTIYEDMSACDIANFLGKDSVVALFNSLEVAPKNLSYINTESIPKKIFSGTTLTNNSNGLSGNWGRRTFLNFDLERKIKGNINSIITAIKNSLAEFKFIVYEEEIIIPKQVRILSGIPAKVFKHEGEFLDFIIQPVDKNQYSVSIYSESTNPLAGSAGSYSEALITRVISYCETSK